jgi:hypothetical protein
MSPKTDTKKFTINSCAGFTAEERTANKEPVRSRAKTWFLIPLLLVIASVQILAADGKITINSPASGAMVDATKTVTLNYEAILSSKGDHLHLYINDKRIDVLHQLKASIELKPLAPGKHKICLTENTKWHKSTGLETCIEVISK